MRTRLLLISMVVGAAAVIVIVFAVSASEGRSRLTKVVDCIQKAGYRTTTAIHDDGRRSVASSAQTDVQLLLAGSDRTRQVHEPSDTFTAVDRDSSAIADIRVPQRSATTIRQYHSLPTRTRITIASWRA